MTKRTADMLSRGTSVATSGGPSGRRTIAREDDSPEAYIYFSNRIRPFLTIVVVQETGSEGSG